MNTTLLSSDSSHIPISILRYLAIALLAGFVTVQLCSLALSAFNSPVSFDGAMNLQVAANLVEGEGYSRFYDEWRLFPKEVQTNAPFILPAAGVFMLTGVTPVSAQLISVLYLIALAGAVIWLIRPAGGWFGGLAAAALVLMIPQMERFGMKGYGEIPALFWFLIGMGMICRGMDRPGRTLFFLSGACLGLAYLTKTVMLLPIGVLAMTLVAWTVRRDGAGKVVLVAAGGLLVVGLFELWKLYQFGDIRTWLTWWIDQYNAIMAQAGVTDRFADSAGIYEKLRTHVAALAHGMRISPYPLLLLAPFVLALFIWAIRRRASGAAPESIRFLALVLSLCIGAYFFWWLAITPTEKAWYRRIINGVILLSLSIPILLAVARYSARRYALMVGLPAILVLSVLLFAGFRFLDLSFPRRPAPDLVAVTKVSEFMREHRNGARFYGRGWYSAPVFSLYSGVPVYELEAHRHALEDRFDHYLLVDVYFAATSQEDSALAGMERETVVDAPPWGRVIKFSDKN